MLESTHVHTRLNIKGHPSNPQRDVHTSLQALCILTKDMDQSFRVNSSGLRKELRLACLLSPQEADTESQLQDKSEMWLEEMVMLNRVSYRAGTREKNHLSPSHVLPGYRRAQCLNVPIYQAYSI